MPQDETSAAISEYLSHVMREGDDDPLFKITYGSKKKNRTQSDGFSLEALTEAIESRTVAHSRLPSPIPSNFPDPGTPFSNRTTRTKAEHNKAIQQVKK